MQRLYGVSIAGLTTLFPFASTACADGMGNEDGWHMMGGGGVMWLFWIVAIAAVVYLLVNVSKKTGRDTPEDTPLDILKTRYAQGEISEDEYEQMKRKLHL